MPFVFLLLESASALLFNLKVVIHLSPTVLKPILLFRKTRVKKCKIYQKLSFISVLRISKCKQTEQKKNKIQGCTPQIIGKVMLLLASPKPFLGGVSFCQGKVSALFGWGGPWYHTLKTPCLGWNLNHLLSQFLVLLVFIHFCLVPLNFTNHCHCGRKWVNINKN